MFFLLNTLWNTKGPREFQTLDEVIDFIIDDPEIALDPNIRVVDDQGQSYLDRITGSM